MYTTNIDVRWADLDPNFHVLHSRYYDFCAYSRTKLLHDHGITAALMQKQKIGPILFKEECVFRKEIKFGDVVTVTTQMSGANDNFTKWQMAHNILLGESTVAAIVKVTGSWLDIEKRKIAAPGKEITELFMSWPKGDNFETM